MARINQASLRAQLDDCRAQFEAIKQKGEAGADIVALFNLKSSVSKCVRIGKVRYF